VQLQEVGVLEALYCQPSTELDTKHKTSFNH
jgi:hypothetical protein